MKRLIAGILAILYLSTSTGATIHFHYCMGKLVSWSLWKSPNSTCNKCGMKMSHKKLNEGCCKDEFKQVKVEKNQQLTGTDITLVHPVSVAVPVSSIEISSVGVSFYLEVYPHSHAPPGGDFAIYLRNSVFLI